MGSVREESGNGLVEDLDDNSYTLDAGDESAYINLQFKHDPDQNNSMKTQSPVINLNSNITQRPNTRGGGQSLNLTSDGIDSLF